MRGAARTRDAHLKPAVSTPQPPVFRLARAGVVFGRVPPLNALAEVSLAVHAGFAVTASEDGWVRLWPLDFSDYLMEVHNRCMHTNTTQTHVHTLSRN